MTEAAPSDFALCVLGHVLVRGRDGQPIEPSGGLGRCLLVSLALSRGGAASTSALIDDLWGDESPKNARAALQTLISRVRSEVGEGVLESRAGGYALTAVASATDLGRARELRDTARASVAAGDVGAARADTTLALCLWRGTPGADVPGALGEQLFAVASTLRGELQRLRIVALLGGEEFAEAIIETGSLLADFPLDEELQGWRMRALAGAGRRNDAVASFAAFRATLRDELGTSPSAELVRLNAQLLSDDPEPNDDHDPNDDATPSDIAPGGETAAPSVAADTQQRGRFIGLRTAPNQLLGRSADLEAAEALLGSHRLVTILGPGGLGKTRLAQELGRRASASTPTVIVVELASVRSGDDLTLALGSTLGIREVNGGGLKLNDPGVRLDIRERILTALSETDTLLIVDNCEHIVDAAAGWISDILASTTTVRVLTTSRSPLAISGENVYSLDSLQDSESDGQLGPAGQLFVERALAARPGATLPSDVIARLCVRLDGLPLAIELAAARVRSMSVEEIERRLSNRFALLTSGERTAPERHRTLLAVIDWSWNLLTEPERILLRRLSRFPDGFSATAAQTVGALDDGHDVADALDGLVNQSLATVSENPSTGLLRFRMLETVREFGEMALVDAGEDEPVRAAMSRWGHDFATTTMTKLTAPDQVRTFQAVMSEQDNLITVLRAAIDDSDPDVVVTVFATLAYYWLMRGANSDVAGFAGSVLRATKDYRPDAAHTDPAIAAYTIICGSAFFGEPRAVLLARSRMRALKRHYSASDPQIDVLADVILAVPDIDKAGAILAASQHSLDHGLAGLASLISSQLDENSGDLEGAMAGSRRAYELAVPIGNVWLYSTAAQSLASLYSQRGDSHRALEWAEISRQGMSELQATNDLHQISWLIAMNEIGSEPERARRVFESFVSDDDGTSRLDHVDLRSIGLSGLAEIALGEGRIDEGLALLSTSVEEYGLGRGRMAPWYTIVSAANVCAHVLADRVDPAIDDLARRMRSRFIASSRRRRELIDIPVLGTAAIALATWMLARGRAGSGATPELAVRLMTLGEVLGARQDLPSLHHSRLEEFAAVKVGRTTVDAARASVKELPVLDALTESRELVSLPEVRELFSAPPREV